MVMIHINKVPAAVATAVLFLVVVIAPQWTKAQPLPPLPPMSPLPPLPPMSPLPPLPPMSPFPPMPKMDPTCITEVSDILQNCYSTFSLTPSDICCKNLKSASAKQVTCVCDNFIAHPFSSNLTRPFYNQINTGCGVVDKYACNGTSEGGDPKGGDDNGGAMNKIAGSMGLFGLVTSLFFLLF
ncbi:unnamed protein product [Eruca vesicaria subsp. sativa]|uniref:Bifunctional inhibitor/plant lipid transfer protein/seed storage helical domain-containing protein n=1 Tax=Eruca vesicaria subsp. sativa TaxID=29727 RepID=A0ABC8JHD1_ERUVS|nr:unnamed protein product [Eruca vesicaria subsp. sativa]